MYVSLVTKGIVSLHGGTISVHSDGEGYGSTFAVELRLHSRRNNLPNHFSIHGDVTESLHIRANERSITANQVSRSTALKKRDSSPVTYESMNRRIHRPLKSSSVGCSDQSSAYAKGDGSISNESSKEVADKSSAGNLQINSVLVNDIQNEIENSSRFGSSSQNVEVYTNEEYFIAETNPVADKEVTSVRVPIAIIAKRSSMRVLVVDDATSNRKMVSRSLRDTYGEVDEAVDGVDAVSKVRLSMETQRPYDLILMDFFMPNMDGPTAVKIIKEELGFRGTVVGLTGNALPSEINTFLSHGAERVLIKPVNISVLRSILN